MREAVPKNQGRRPAKGTERWRRWTGVGSTLVLASGLTMAGAVPAQAVDGENRSQALAEFINLDALGIDAADAVTAQQNFLENAGEEPDTSTIDAELLNQLAGADSDGASVELGPDGLGAGALSGYAYTPEPTAATAASGAVASDGTIAVEGDASGFASVDLTSALNDLGVETEGVVDELSLELGVLASSARETEGAVESDYTLAGAQLRMDSPSVDALSGTLSTLIAEAQGDLNVLLGSEGPVQEALEMVTTEPIEVDLGGMRSATVDPGSPQLTASVELSGVAADVLDSQLVSDSGLVTIDLENGDVWIDLAQLHGGSLNDLPANTSLLTEAEIAQITEEVTALTGELTDDLTAGVDAEIESTEVTLNLEPQVEVMGGLMDGSIAVQIDTTVGQLLAGGEDISPEAVEVTGEFTVEGMDMPATDIEAALTESITSELLPSLAEPFATSFEEGVGTSIEDTVNGAVFIALDDLRPILQDLDDVATLTVNEQEAPGDLGDTSFTVRALAVDVLPTSNTVALHLASSSIYAEDEAAPAYDTSITADPSNVEQNDSTDVTGGGFAPDESVTVAIPGPTEGEDPITVDTTTNSDGEFTVALPIPAEYPTGDLEVSAAGDVSGTPATTEITVVAPSDGSGGDAGDVEPSVSVEPGEAEAGQRVMLRGAGFVPGSLVDLEIADREGEVIGFIEDVEVGSNGSFARQWTVPEGTSLGDFVYSAIDDEGNGDTAPLEVVADSGSDGEADDVDPSVSVDPNMASPGDEVVIEGGGFSPDSTVDIAITNEDGDVIGAIEDVEVGEDGDFSQDWTVPEGANPGDVTVTAEDAEGNSADETLVIVDAAGPGDDDGTEEPAVSIDPDTAEPGDTVTIEGDDYAPGTTVIIEVVDEDGNTIDTIDAVQVGDDGTFAVDWALPSDLSPGQLVVTATDEDGNSASGVLDVVGAEGAGGTGDEDGAAAQSGANDGSDRFEGLATTGATVATFGAIALVLTLMGVGLYVVSRQRRLAEED